MNQTAKEVAALADLIARNGAIENYRFFIILAALGVILIAAGALLKSFFSERGKLLASNAAYQTALEQLVRSTESTEAIKIGIAHSDWTEKELRTLKRTKLEELITAVSTAKLTLEGMCTEEEKNGSFKTDSAKYIASMEQLATLYFPELENEVKEISLAYRHYQIWRINAVSQIAIAYTENKSARELLTLAGEQKPSDPKNVNDRISQLNTSVDQIKFTLNELGKNFPERNEKFIIACNDLEKRAALLMQSIIKPTTYLKNKNALKEG